MDWIIAYVGLGIFVGVITCLVERQLPEPPSGLLLIPISVIAWPLVLYVVARDLLKGK